MPIYCEGKFKKGYLGFDGGHTLKKVYGPGGLVWQDTILVAPPTELNPNFYYDGIRKTNLYNCPTGVTMTGSDRGTDGGQYVARYIPDEGYAWSDDGSQREITVTMSIYYKWNIWNAVTSYVDNSELFATVPAEDYTEKSVTSGTYMTGGTGYSIENGKFKLSGVSVATWKTLTTSYATITSNLYCSEQVDSKANEFDVIYEAQNSTISFKGKQGKIRFDNSAQGARTVNKHTVVASYSKGDTQEGSVYSFTITDYPENGYQNGHWYVKTW